MLPDTNITFVILSYAFHLHRAKICLKRLSRIGFNMATCCPEEWSAHFDRFVKKRVEIPITSNQTVVMCGREFDKFYSVREIINYLTPDH